MNPANIQHPTTNAQHPTKARMDEHWMFDVGRWMLDVFQRFKGSMREISFKGEAFGWVYRDAPVTGGFE